MRLLSTRDLSFRTVPDRDGKIPSYAVLSHCWSTNANDEVLYHDILNGTAPTKKAYAKLSGLIKIAKESNPSYDWIWIDTCCIDKTSSAELSESLNSMYSFYETADVCYTYLEDKMFSSVSEMVQSNWFNRGWTLQELIAPKEVLFFDRSWTRIGSKRSVTIQNIIADRTKVSVDILDGSTPVQSVSVAKRMSWAAGRKTTRPEDMAYCLMGIFAVNMPMLYGEGGQNAFHRLQEQIMKDSNDHTIFLWTGKEDAKSGPYHGLLADHPDAFADSQAYVGYNDWEDAEPFQPSNRGLRINFHLDPVRDSANNIVPSLYYAALNCPIPSHDRGYYGFVGIILKKLDVGVKQYTRVECHRVVGLNTRADRAYTVYVRQKSEVQDHEAVTPFHFFQPRRLMMPYDQYDLSDVAYYPLSAGEQYVAPRPMLQGQSWLRADQASSFQIFKRAGKLSAILYFRRRSDGAILSVVLGSKTDLDVGFTAVAGHVSNITDAERGAILEPSGTTIETEDGTHSVRVDVEIKVDMPRKLYLLDLTISGRPTPPLAFLPEVVHDAVDYLADGMLETVIGASDEYQNRQAPVSRRGLPSFRRKG